MPTRKRVNRKVLGIVLGAAVAATAAGVVGYKYLVRPDPRQFELAADRAARQGRWVEAARDYGVVLRARPGDPRAFVRYGEILRYAAAEDPDLVGKDRDAYLRALEIDPRDVNALDHLVQWYREAVQFDTRSEAFAQLRDAADRLADAAPDHPDVKYAPIAVLQGWMQNVETPPDKVDAAVARLTTLLARQRFAATQPVASATPSTRPAKRVDPDLPTWIANAAIRRAADAFKSGKPAEAAEHLKQARTLFDQILAEDDQDAALQYRAFAVYRALAAAGRDADQRKADVAQAAKCIDRARALTNPKDPLYVEIHLTAATAAARTGDPATAAKILRDLYALNPRNPIVRLQLARQLGADPATRREAIDVLAKGQGDTLTGLQKLRQRAIEITTLTQLTDLRIEAWTDARAKHDDAKAADLAKQIDADVAKLDGAGGDDPRLAAGTLSTKGRWLLARGDSVGAVQTLARARAQVDQIGPAAATESDDIAYRLAVAYIAARQTGQAKPILEQLCRKYPDNPQTHRTLVAVYRDENDLDNAKRHYDELKRLLPNDPGVARLALLFIDPAKDKQAVDDQLTKLPESTRIDRLRKALVARQLRRPDEMVRLLADQHAADPADPEPARGLARYYLAAGQNDKARAIVTETLMAGSTDPQLKVLATAFEKGLDNREAIDAERLAQINATPDPFTRELDLIVFYQDQGKTDEVVKHFAAAKALTPDDPRLADMQFQFYVAQAQAAGDLKSPAAADAIAKAESTLPLLARSNRDQANGDLFLFRLQLVKRDFAAALATARKLTQRLPDFAQSWLTYGQAFEALGQYDEAVRQYLLALDRQANNTDALRGLITCSYQLGKPQEALRYIRRAREVVPGDPAFRNMELAYQLNFGDPALVIPTREAAVKQNPDNPQAYADLAATYARAAAVKQQGGDTTAATELAQKARDTYTTAIAKWPDGKAFYRPLAELALATGGDAIAKAEAAIKSLAARPSMKADADPHLLLAAFYTRLNRAGDAENEFAEAMKLRPDDNTYRQYATFLTQRGRYTDALAALDKAKQTPEVTGQRIDLLVTAGRFKDAESVGTAALAAKPDDPVLLGALAMIHFREGDLSHALEQADKALAQNPTCPIALYVRGMVNLSSATGDLPAAVRDLTQFRDRAPDNLDARIALAQALRRNNDNDGAVRELEAAFRLAPNNKALRATLVEAYTAVVPPRWDDAQRLLTDAQNDPALKTDPDWPRLESAVDLARKDTDNAVESAARAVELSQRNPAYVRSYVATLIGAGKYDAALAESDKLLAAARAAGATADSTPPWLHQQRGVILKAKGDRAGAMSEFESALRAAFAAGDAAAAAQVTHDIATGIGTDDALKLITDRARTDPKMQLLASVLYQAKGDLGAATASAEKALNNPALAPTDRPGVLRTLGAQYLSYRPTPKSDKALAAYQELLEVEPDDVWALNNVSCLLVDHFGRPREALPYAERAHKQLQRQGRTEPLVTDTYGWTLVRCGRVGEGTSVLLQALDRKSFPDVHYHLGEAYLLGNQPDEALKQFTAADTLLAKAPAPDATLKERVDAGLKKATDAVRTKSGAKVSFDAKTP